MALLMNKWIDIIVIDDEWVHPLAKILPALVNNLWWSIVMDDYKFGWNHLVIDSNCNIVNL